ncbi:MAG TPA: DNA-directed RNA polymerase subunit omega [Candidatus Marinimicrobia bacterium]|jgi:DNA-directed RNA polymerase omega subunit|nr:DNA-directed RNA polymerase subunit omega [Candidatus Neomarinimicrobiota bacterium]
MAVKPVSLRKLEEKTKNIYEAVVVMSKRARQINQERYEEQVMELSEELELDVLDESPDIKPEDYEEKEKVTTIAVNEFIEGEVNWRVLEDPEEDQ